MLGICGLFSRLAPGSSMPMISTDTPVIGVNLNAPNSTETNSSLPTHLATGTIDIPVSLSLPDCIHDNQPQQGKVIKVVDGDTIHVLISGQDFTVRYIGMNTPENTNQHEYFGPEAFAKNSQLVAGQEVSLYKDISETDRYGRLLRYVFINKSFINYEMVIQGFAKAIKYPPDTACAAVLSQAQDSARASGLGLWAGNTAITARPSSVSNSLKITNVDKIAEYVTIQNPTATPVALTGWRLVSEKGSQTCGLGGIIQDGASLQIWTKSGPGFSCNLPENIWNNQESDPAVLYNPQGQEVARY